MMNDASTSTEVVEDGEKINYYDFLFRKRFDTKVSLVERAVELTDWRIVGVMKAQICYEMCNMCRYDNCFKFKNNEILNQLCFSCRYHKMRDFLKWTVATALRMISWVN